MRVVIEQVKDLTEGAFTRQHFEAIASIFKNANPDKVTRESVVYLAGEMATFFKQDNPGFDKERFKKACGL